MEGKETDLKASYTAADSVPLKLLLDRDLLEAAARGRIPPIHVQLVPTNRCNRSCPFCSCGERDRTVELDLGAAMRIMSRYRDLGTKAVTITGGGEPLAYPGIKELIEHVHTLGIRVGLTTNGTLLHELPPETAGRLTWCRISNGDDREFSGEYRERLAAVAAAAPAVDWAFSHVVTDRPNLGEILKVVDFANRHGFTHVRIVSDLFRTGTTDLGRIRDFLRQSSVSDGLVIYQGRKGHVRGGDCYICHLKPLIGPDGKVYTCCGVQYAKETPDRDLPQEFCLGDAEDVDRLFERSGVPFDGSVCARCYYMNYNSVLKAMLSEVRHREFL